MKAVMISIQPKWVEKIASGEKTIEVRKTRPKIDTPFKCYIYEINWKDNSYWSYRHKGKLGKVIGEFVCDNIYPIKNRGSNFVIANEEQGVTNEIARQSCLDYMDMVCYLVDKDGYAWHISDLIIYDEPKELFEFYSTKHKPMSEWTDNDFCQQCKYHKWICGMKSFVERGIPMREECTLKKPEPICEYTPPLTRPPQSWCYVEEKEKENGTN